MVAIATRTVEAKIEFPFKIHTYFEKYFMVSVTVKTYKLSSIIHKSISKIYISIIISHDYGEPNV